MKKFLLFLTIINLIKAEEDDFDETCEEHGASWDCWGGQSCATNYNAYGMAVSGNSCVEDEDCDKVDLDEESITICYSDLEAWGGNVD